MFMRKIIRYLPLLFLLVPQTMFSQLLQGRVLNEDGELAPGVTVRFQNTANGISTNRDGTFKIMATKLPDTLVFSAVGYESYKVVITEKNIKDPTFEVVLLNSRIMGSEVVVTALATKRSKKEISYSTSTSSPDMLSGRIAGVGSKSSESSPIILRGIRTL